MMYSDQPSQSSNSYCPCRHLFDHHHPHCPSCFGFTIPRASAVSRISDHSGRGISTPSAMRPYVMPPSLLMGLRICSIEKLSVPNTPCNKRTSQAKTHRRINQVPLLINSILARPKPHPLHNSQHPRLLPRRSPALKLLRLHQLGLNTEDRLFDPARLDLLALRRRQPSESPLRYPIRRIDTRSIRRFDLMLADDIDHAFLCLVQVPQRVLRIVETASVPKDEHRRIVVDHGEVAERRQVRRRPIRRARGNKADRPRDDGGDHELVVESRGAAGRVRVD